MSKEEAERLMLAAADLFDEARDVRGEAARNLAWASPPSTLPSDLRTRFIAEGPFWVVEQHRESPTENPAAMLWRWGSGNRPMIWVVMTDDYERVRKFHSQDEATKYSLEFAHKRTLRELETQLKAGVR